MKTAEKQLKKMHRRTLALLALLVAIAFPAAAHNRTPFADLSPATPIEWTSSSGEITVDALPIVDAATIAALDEAARIDIDLPADPLEELDAHLAAIISPADTELLPIVAGLENRCSGFPVSLIEPNVRQTNELSLKLHWGHDHVRNRWFDPGTGTWLTPDPLGYQDSSNLYAFAGGDPVNRRDPTGKCWAREAQRITQLIRDTQATVANSGAWDADLGGVVDVLRSDLHSVLANQEADPCSDDDLISFSPSGVTTQMMTWARTYNELEETARQAGQRAWQYHPHVNPELSAEGADVRAKVAEGYGVTIGDIQGEGNAALVTGAKMYGEGKALEVLGAGVVLINGRVANAVSGAEREQRALAMLKAQHPGAIIQRERLLRDITGAKAVDPLGSGRRVDFVVFDPTGEHVIDMVEVTSPTANKLAQAAKEKAIRQAGPVYVRNRQTRRVVDVTNIVTRRMDLP